MRAQRAIAPLLLAGFLLSACGGSATPAASTASGSTAATSTGGAATAAATSKNLNIAMWSAPASFNGMTSNSSYDIDVAGMMFDSLDWQSPDQQFHPLLASSWDVSSDSKTFTFHLNPKANWTDGQPVTANDVAWTLTTDADPKVPAVFGSLLNVLVGTNNQGQNVDPTQPLAGVKVVDDKTVQLLTKAPTDPNELLYNIGYEMQIYPQHVLKSVADTDLAKAPFFQNPNVSDGPYEFVKYVNSQYVQLKPNPNYYLGAPKDTVYIKIVPATSMLAELRDGTVDATYSPGLADVPLQDWPSVASLPNVKQDPVPGTTTQFMEINDSKPYLSSPQVRQAITMAIDRGAMVKSLLKGLGAVPIGPVNPLYKNFYDTNLQPWPYDPTKAKQMLQAANFPFSTPLKLLVPTGNQIRMESAPLIQQNLQAVGLNVQIQQFDFATMLSTAKSGNFDFALIGSGFGVDPSGSALFFQCGGSLNYSKFCDQAIDNDYKTGQSTPVLAQRQAAYNDLQQRIHDDAPDVFLYIQNGLMAYNTSVNQATIPTAFGMQQPWAWGFK
ncbi:MAG TPA: ABC transporter substrate-binding protein [Bacillota bacterium]|nr:ABC transporter substrate-binding protein [Bacillota bacterium]